MGRERTLEGSLGGKEAQRASEVNDHGIVPLAVPNDSKSSTRGARSGPYGDGREPKARLSEASTVA